MQAGEGGSCRRPWQLLGPLLLSCLTGCALSRPQCDRALLADHGLQAHQADTALAYLAYCPDVLELSVEAHPELSGRRALGLDGRIDLGDVGRLPVEGLNVTDIAQRVATRLDVPPESVRVRVAEYRSQQIYLAGQVVGLQRAVAYQGPETVLDLLHRTGGITAGAAPEQVYVVRAHLSEGRQPEVFHVDLRAILLKHDLRTNVALQPGDQVFVAETRPCCFEKCVPPCLRTVYEVFCGLWRPGGSQPNDGAGKDAESKPGRDS
jgi:polysaccharide export outer membrane protein